MALTSSALVHRILASIGRPAEAELYLSLFRAERPESFALIAVDADVAGIAEDALAVDLEFLAELGLTPVVAFEDAGQAAHLAAWLGDAFPGGVVAADGAAAAARAGRIALCVHAPPASQSSPLAGVTDPTWSASGLGVLATALCSRKVVLLGASSGITPAGAPEPLSMVDLTVELDDLLAGDVLPAGQRDLLRDARALIDAASHPMTVAVTSPLDLLRELFTVRGAGTLIRRGVQVTAHDSLDAVDRARLHGLIEASFGRTLSADFWSRPLLRIFIAGDYRGAAVVSPSPHGAYLSKLAVGAPARGEGIGRDLWRALVRDYPRLTWRSRARNPIAPWYQEQCDGMVKLGDWNVYWRGLDSALISAAIADAAAAPIDLV
jgi:acetylglutamate kinase